MNVTPHITRARLTVIISSSIENPLLLRDGISSLPVETFISSGDVNPPTSSQDFQIPTFQKPDQTGKTCNRSGSKPTGPCIRWGSLHPRKAGGWRQSTTVQRRTIGLL